MCNQKLKMTISQQLNKLTNKKTKE